LVPLFIYFGWSMPVSESCLDQIVLLWRIVGGGEGGGVGGVLLGERGPPPPPPPLLSMGTCASKILGAKSHLYFE
jgi:hypothetical protein